VAQSSRAGTDWPKTGLLGNMASDCLLPLRWRLIGPSRASKYASRYRISIEREPRKPRERWSMKVSSKNGKPQSRNERHGAAWGKPLALLALILAGQFAFAQVADEAGSREPLSPRITAELNHELLQARQGDGGDATVKVIVQYKKAPRKEALARLQNQGAQLNRKLDVVRGAAFSLPVNTLASLENDPEVEYVSVDHPLKGMDDYTNAAMNVSAAWNAGYNGTGIGVAVVDSGINDSHPDLWDPTESYSRVVYHQDFTGTSTSNQWGRTVYDLYGHGTHVAGIIGGNGYLSNGTY